MIFCARNILRLILAYTFGFLPLPIFAAYGFKLDGTLDKEAISHAYFEGDFAKVLPPLLAYSESMPANANLEDSVFCYKYMSVIYASDPKTRLKGEAYMLQLIKIVPAVQLIDLYVSDNILSIFKNVKQGYEQQQEHLQGHDKNGHSKTNTTPIAEGKSNNWIWWTAAGVGLTTAVVATYYAFDLASTPGKKHVLAN